MATKSVKAPKGFHWMKKGSIFKKRRRKNSRRKNGHRQEFSLIKINKIFSKDGKILSESSKAPKTTKAVEKKEELKSKF